MVEPNSFVVDPLFDKFFDAAQLLYWYVPLNPYRRFLLGTPTRRALIIGRFLYYFVLFSQLTLLTLYAMFLVDSIANGGDFLITAATFVWFIIDINAIQALYFSWNSAGELVALFHDLHDHFPKTRQEKALVDADKWAQEWTSKMFVQTTVFVTAVVGMCLQPFLLSLVGYLSDGVWRNQLPLALWLPFDPLVMPVYPVVYLVEMWFFLVNSVIMVAVEAVLGAVTMLVCLQFKGVAHKFRSIAFGVYKQDVVAMREAIQAHNIILDISNKTRNVFSVALFFIFLLSSIVICIFGFLILNERHAFSRFQYINNLICYLVFCSVYGYYGNTLIEHVSI